MTQLVGNSSIGAFTSATNVNHLSGENAEAMQYVASADGNATEIFFYANRRGEGESVKLFIADTSGNILAISSPVSVGTGGAAWLSGAISSTAITNGATYYLGFYGTSGDGRQGVMSSGSGNYVATDGNYATPASTLALSADGGNPNMALYADGTASGGASVNLMAGKLGGLFAGKL